jgi:hypothetical protein
MGTAETIAAQGDEPTPATLADKTATESYYAFNMSIELSNETALFRSQLAAFLDRCEVAREHAKARRDRVGEIQAGA